MLARGRACTRSLPALQQYVRGFTEVLMETRPLEASEAPSDRQRDVRPTANARWLSHSVLLLRAWCLCYSHMCI